MKVETGTEVTKQLRTQSERRHGEDWPVGATGNSRSKGFWGNTDALG